MLQFRQMSEETKPEQRENGSVFHFYEEYKGSEIDIQCTILESSGRSLCAWTVVLPDKSSVSGDARYENIESAKRGAKSYLDRMEAKELQEK